MPAQDSPKLESRLSRSKNREARQKSQLGLARRVVVWLGRGVAAVLLSLVFLAAVVAGVVVHIDLPVSRRLAADLLTSSLTEYFQGSLTVGEIDHLGLRGARVDEVVVHDPNGDRVLRVEKLRVRASFPSILRKLLFAQGKQTLVIDHVRAERVECFVLPESDSSNPTIVAAFTPVPRRNPAVNRTTQRQIRVWFDDIEIGHGWGRGVFHDLPTVDLELAKVQGTVLATNRGAAVDVERFGAVVRGLGGADARGTGEAHIRAPGAMWSNFDGFVGDVGISAFAHVKKSQLEVRLDLPRATPGAARSVWKDWPLHDDVNVHVEAKGELPLLAAKATLEVGKARVATEAKLRLAGDVGVTADIDAKHVDVRSVVPSAPPTDISGKARVVLFKGADELVVKVNGYSLPATVADVDVPATDVTGDLEDGGFTGTATLHEKGIPLKVLLTVESDGAMELDIDARTFRMQGAPRIAAVTPADGVAKVRVKGRVVDRQLEASVDGTISGFTLHPIHATNLRLIGKAHGPLEDPTKLDIDGRLSGTGIKTGYLSFQKVDIQARGPVMDPFIVAKLLDEEGPSFEVSGRVEHQVPRARNVEVAVSRGGARIEGTAGVLDLSDGVSVERLALSGDGGRLEGNLTLRPELIQARAQGEGIDLAAVGRLLGLEKRNLSGRVGFDAEVSAGRDVQRGRVSLRLDKGSLDDVAGVAVDFTSELEGAHLTGGGEFSMAGTGELEADWDTHLGGLPTELKSWKDLVGHVGLEFKHVELPSLKKYVPEEWGLTELVGTVRGRADFDRRLAAALPTVNITAVANNLSVTRATTPQREGQPPTRTTYDDLDIQLGLSINGESGFTLANATLYHQREPFALTQAKLNLDLVRVVEEPRELVEIVRDAPGTIDVELKSHAIRDLPAWMRPSNLEGRVSAEAHMTGTLREPLLSLESSVRGLRLTNSEFGKPIDVQALLNYRVIEGAFGGDAEVRSQGQRIAYITLAGTSPGAAVLEDHQEGKPRWRGEASVVFFDFPLDVVPQLHEARVGGTVKGALTLKRQDRRPTVDASLEVNTVSVERTQLGDGKVEVESSQDSATAMVTLTKDKGWIRAKAKAGLAWDRGWPSVDEKRPITANLDAKRFEAAVFGPFVGEVLTALNGKIDADMTVKLNAAPRQVSADQEPEESVVVWHPRVSGTAEMRDGAVQLAGLGLELRGVGFDVKVTDVGAETKVEVLNLSAQGRESSANLQGRADFYLHGLELQRGLATLTATDLAIPVGGVALAKATTARDERDKNRGQHEPVTVRIEREPDKMVVDVEIPTLMARLPPSVTRSVIDTTDNASINVLQPLRKPEPPRRKDAFPWKFVFDVGPRTRVFYDEFEVKVSGHPEILLGEKTQLGGYIDLDRGGRLPVLGKEFEIESGHITLMPDEPANPRLDVTASWESRYGTIYLRVRGRWNNPELQLDADGGYTQDQIWIILAGGSPDDPTGSQQGGSVQAAYAAARTLGVTRLFESDRLGFTPDTSEGKTKARVSYRVTDKVRVEAIGGSEVESTSTSSSDEAGEERRFVGAGAIEYRINKNWSVRTEAGNASAEVDLLWQYRY